MSLIACGGGGGSDGDDDGSLSDPMDIADPSITGPLVDQDLSSTANTNESITIDSGTTIPDELISNADTSAVVDAIARGADLNLELLRTQFFCYYNINNLGVPETDFSTPHATVNFVGNEFTLTGVAGDHTGTIIDNLNSDSVEFTFDSGIDDLSMRIEFDLFGQRLYNRPNNSELASCYQSGASHERGLHQFLLNTPEQGVYTCEVANNGVADANSSQLTLIDQSQYSYNGVTGEYRVGALFESTASVIRFDTGAFESMEGEYTESPTTGTQQFSVVSDFSDSGAICTRQREPRPFKRFGATQITPPQDSSVPLSGSYYFDNGDIDSVGWAVFTADGFINTEYAVPGENICHRTLPNGLAPCIEYTYDGGATISLSRGNEQADLPITQFDDGSILITALGRYVPVNTPSIGELIGQWRFESASTFDEIDTSLCILGFCGPTGVSGKTLEFSANGRFSDNASSQSLTSVNVPGLSLTSTSQSQSAESGNYQLNGAGLSLQYDSGRIDPPVFLHLIDQNTLVVGYVVYRRVL